MNQPIQNPPNLTANEEEFTLADLIRLVQKYTRLLFRNWLIVLLAMLPVAIWFSWEAWHKSATYKARLTFTLNEAKGSSMSSILGGLGGLLGGGSSGYQLEKIMEISRSLHIIGGALMDSVTYDGRTDFYANFLIEKEGIDKEWAENSKLKAFRFTHADRSRFTRNENQALLRCYAYFVGGENIEPKFTISLNEDSGVLTITIITSDEALSIDLTNTLYSKISRFYVEKSIEPEARTLSIMQAKRDSISNALKRNDRSSAEHDDSNNGLLYNITKVPGKQFTRNDHLLTLMYGEVIKNAELADFALKNSMPFLTIIDAPIAPIKPTPPGRVRALVIGLFLGGLLGYLFVILRQLVKEALPGKA